MNIRDMVKVEKKNQLFHNCALALRYSPKAFNFTTPLNFDDLELCVEKQLITKNDWVDVSDEKAKEMDLIHNCIDIAEVDELLESDIPMTNKTEQTAVLISHLLRNSNSIMMGNRRGMGNFVLVNNAFYNKLVEFDSFSTPFFNKATDEDEYLLNGVIRMSKATFDEKNPIALLGYAGKSPYDGGIVLVEDDENKKYAIASRFYDTDKYYRVIKIV